MICVFASNLLSNAIFVKGNVYEATCHSSRQVFLKCPIGMNLQIHMDYANCDGSWVYESENGTYRFDIV